MNKLNTFLNNAFDKSKSILAGVNLTYEGNSVEGIFNTQSHGAELIPGGLNNQYEATFLMRNTDIETAGVTFVKGKKCTLQSRDWKIEEIETGEVTTFLMLAGWHESTVNS